MSLYRKLEKYMEELNLACTQNSGVECELYSVIAAIIRESKQGDNISIRDVTVRRESEKSKRLKGVAGFPDFVVLSREERYDAKIYGCIEVKAVFKKLDADKLKPQLEGHIESYGKVIYTNGLSWRFYYKNANKPVWEVVLGEYRAGTICWYEEEKWKDLLNKLDTIEWSVR